MNFDFNDLKITHSMVQMIGELEYFKGSWKLLGKLSPEKLRTLKKVAAIESIGSSTRIEGSKLSDGEVENLLTNLNTTSFASRDEQEVAGYSYACEEIFNSFDLMPLTENTIKHLHHMLLRYSTKDEHHKGRYKNLSNSVAAFDENGKNLGLVFETATPFETPFLMEKLLKEINDALEQKNMHPILAIGCFIVSFLAIHPFQDGNGRLSRLLTTLLLLKSDFSYVIYASLESIIEKNKESYYLALRRTQQSFHKEACDFEPWMSFFLTSLVRQKQHLEAKIVRGNDIITGLNPLSEHIVQLLQNHSKMTFQDFVLKTKANQNTIKKHLKTLTDHKVIMKYGKGRATFYTSI
jgi:Fic family protein